MGSYTDQAREYVWAKCGKGDIWLRAIDCLKDLGWNIHWSRSEANWRVLVDHKTILVTSSWAAVQAFVYGLLKSSLELAHLGQENLEKGKLFLTLTPVRKEKRQPSPTSRVFHELQAVNDALLVFEWRYMALARSFLLYRAYQERTYPSEREDDFQEIGRLYERKLELERQLKVLTAGDIEDLLVGESEPRHFTVRAEDQLAAVFAFLTLYLGWHWPLHKIDDRWHLWMGDQPFFIGEDELEIRAFCYGLAYAYISLPSRTIEQLRRRPWAGWRRSAGDGGLSSKGNHSK